MLVIDGSYHEGGGQILRTALTLSRATRTPFRIEKIRAGRKRPGLLRQHLAAVRAARRSICRCYTVSARTFNANCSRRDSIRQAAAR